MSRRCELLGADGHWRATERAALVAGDVFRVIDEATGQWLADPETGATRFRAVTDAVRRNDGQYDVETEPVPETEAERAVRVSGTYWPSAASPRLHGINRLRGR